MKLLFVSIFVGVLAYAPCYAFEHLVLPELNAIQHVYQSAADMADSAAVAAN